MNRARILGLAGLKGSGKTTAAEGLPLDWERLNFADPLKNMLVEAGILTSEQAHGDDKEAPLHWLDGVTPRRIMQTLGTEWGRAMHPDLWVKLWRRRAEESLLAGWGVVTADVRFANELAAIRSMGGKAAWIERPGLPAADSHASENSIGPADCDAVLVNDGDAEALWRRVRAAVGA